MALQPVIVRAGRGQLRVATPFAVVGIWVVLILLGGVAVGTIMKSGADGSDVFVACVLLILAFGILVSLRSGRTDFQRDVIVVRSGFGVKRYDRSDIDRITVEDRGTLIPQYGLVAIRLDGLVIELRMVQVVALTRSSASVKRLEAACEMANRWLDDNRGWSGSGEGTR